MQFNFCPHCGSKVPVNSAFCPKCGQQLTDTQEQAQPQFHIIDSGVVHQADTQPINRNFADVGINGFLKQIYGWLFTSLLVAGVCAYISSFFAILMNFWVMLILCIVGFVPMVMVYKNAVSNPKLAIGSLIAFAVVDGFSLSNIFVIYTGQNLAVAFISSSAIFGAMSLIGMTTHKDLTKLSTQMTGLLIALLIGLVINIFLRSPMIALFLSLAGIIIFSILSVCDTKNAIQLYQRYRDSGVSATGIAIMGALSLYMDFENLFLFILQIVSAFTDDNN